MDLKSFGDKVREVRKTRNMTGEALAEKCNMSPSFLRQIEAGKKRQKPVFRAGRSLSRSRYGRTADPCIGKPRRFHRKLPADSFLFRYLPADPDPPKDRMHRRKAAVHPVL